jgi:pentatricopeptide repeat protein
MAATRAPAHVPPRTPVRDKSALLSYVPPDGDGTVQEHFDFYRDPYRRGYAQADGPRLEVSERKVDVEYPQRENVYTPEAATKKIVSQLRSAVGIKLRHPHHRTLDGIYKLYSKLPEPRMLNIEWRLRDRLMRIMALPHKRDMNSMLRYFDLIADVKNAGLTLRRAHWNYALAFATKYTSQAGAQEMDSALKLWRQMEKDANVQANDVTFNILFDVAAKNGNFALAEMMYQEMETRGIEFNRFHHVSLIHYFGLKLDSGGIRAAYKEMVESGEMVDTVVLNCVISGFLKCGEETAAEETYQRMRNSNTQLTKSPNKKNYMVGKMVTKVLMMFAKVGKDHPQLKKSLQTNVQLAPDLRTYHLFVEHYAIKVGNLAKVAQYLDEMQHLRIPIHPTIFLALLKGFYVHGGVPGSPWSAQHLEGVLASLYEARDERAKGLRIDRWMVIWALRAVWKCSADPEAVTKTFEEMQRRWDIPADRHPFMFGFLDNIVQGRDLKSAKHDSGTLLRGYKPDGSTLPS